MRFGKFVNRQNVAASALKVFPLLSTLVPKHAQGEARSSGSKLLKTIALVGAGASGFMSCATIAYADDGLKCPIYPWPHRSILSSYEPDSIRRDHLVFQQSCSSCHGMSIFSYRDLVGAAYTDEETKAIAAEIEVVDCPSDETRPGKLSDRFPNVQTANGGTFPPDLTLITKALQNNMSSLLTGPHPAGVMIREGLHCKPYFSGGAFAATKMLINDDVVEYEDGTPAAKAQMGQDACCITSVLGC